MPGLVALFQKPDDQFLKDLITCIPSILAGIITGYFISKYLLHIWFKTEKAIIYKSIIILFITYIAGIIALLVAWEVTWIVPRVFEWKYTGEFNPWENFLDHYLLIFIYGSIPVGIAGVLNGLFSFIYLKFAK